jgi:hypothetical protein
MLQGPRRRHRLAVLHVMWLLDLSSWCCAGVPGVFTSLITTFAPGSPQQMLHTVLLQTAWTQAMGNVVVAAACLGLLPADVQDGCIALSHTLVRL